MWSVPRSATWFSPRVANAFGVFLFARNLFQHALPCAGELTFCSRFVCLRWFLAVFGSAVSVCFGSSVAYCVFAGFFK